MNPDSLKTTMPFNDDSEMEAQLVNLASETQVLNLQVRLNCWMILTVLLKMMMLKPSCWMKKGLLELRVKKVRMELRFCVAFLTHGKPWSVIAMEQPRRRGGWREHDGSGASRRRRRVGIELWDVAMQLWVNCGGFG